MLMHSYPERNANLIIIYGRRRIGKKRVIKKIFIE